MTRWLIAILIGIPLVLFAYEASRVVYISLTVRETARSTLARLVAERKIQHTQLPDSTRIWPRAEKSIKDVLIKKGNELNIPLDEQDIAIWHDNKNVYCRIAWYQELRVLSFSLGSVLLDFTEEVPI